MFPSSFFCSPTYPPTHPPTYSHTVCERGAGHRLVSVLYQGAYSRQLFRTASIFSFLSNPTQPNPPYPPPPPTKVIPTHYKGRDNKVIRTNRISATERFKPLHKEGQARLEGDSHAHNDQVRPSSSFLLLLLFLLILLQSIHPPTHPPTYPNRPLSSPASSLFTTFPLLMWRFLSSARPSPTSLSSCVRLLVGFSPSPGCWTISFIIQGCSGARALGFWPGRLDRFRLG